MKPDTISIAETAFAKIAGRFPLLNMVRNHDDPVEISISLPPQEGLKYKVWLCLQNTDELHFSAGDHFWLDWFPCTYPERTALYVEAVCGFLDGQYRILDHHRSGKCFKAELQKPEANGWRTIGHWTTIWTLPWKKRTYHVLRNQ